MVTLAIIVVLQLVNGSSKVVQSVIVLHVVYVLAVANEIFEFTGQILGESLANFVMFSSPEAIVLFGGLTRAGNLLLNPTRKHMEENLLPIFKNKVKIIFSELKESDADILGASALVM